jgi:hypothetical protein
MNGMAISDKIDEQRIHNPGKTLVDLNPAAKARTTVKNVWCPHCAGVTTITDFSGDVEEGGL